MQPAVADYTSMLKTTRSTTRIRLVVLAEELVFYWDGAKLNCRIGVLLGRQQQVQAYDNGDYTGYPQSGALYRGAALGY